MMESLKLCWLKSQLTLRVDLPTKLDSEVLAMKLADEIEQTIFYCARRKIENKNGLRA
jgi:hypothetical protein